MLGDWPGVVPAAAADAPLHIGCKPVGDGAPVFVIAEIGVNHDGSVDRAKALIDRAVEAGADAVKFQMRSLSDLYVNGGDADDPGEDLASQYILGVLRRSQLEPADMFDIFDYAIRQGVECLCTPWDLTSLAAVSRFGLPALKVASADLTNHELLDGMAATGRPLLVSTGMSTEAEICQAVALLRARGAHFALLHCLAAYPPRPQDLNLRYLRRLRTLGGGCPVGYSGHERGWTVALGAVALGASIVEKHVTLDRGRPGVDHKISLLPGEFAEMVRAIREMEAALGSAGERCLTRGEQLNRQVLAKSLVAARPLRAGDVITRDAIAVRSPGRGVSPNRVDELVGRRAPRSLAAGECFHDTDVIGRASAPRPYRFRRRWGIPVRYHDFHALTCQRRPDLVEFHLSDRDLDQDPENFLSGLYDFALIVHCPEQFRDDFVIDLASADGAVRRRSIGELERVLSLTRSLAARFSRTPAPQVILNAGGFTESRPVGASGRRRLYQRVGAALAAVDATGLTLLVQTLPPFPWQLGGYRIGNLFGDAAETAWFCQEFGARLCLDVGHTYMGSVERGDSFEDCCARLAAFTAHLHLSDAAGVDREGLPIGEGEIDFAALAAVLDAHAPGASFIPEIWEGHWNDGEGFWRALDRLETWFGAQEQEEADHGLV